jgi:hypothetical protein
MMNITKLVLINPFIQMFWGRNMSQAKPEAIEIFCRVFSRELTRNTGFKIVIDPRSLTADSKKPVRVSKDRKGFNSPKQKPEK